MSGSLSDTAAVWSLESSERELRRAALVLRDRRPVFADETHDAASAVARVLDKLRAALAVEESGT